MLAGLLELKNCYALIGDVRGQGLYVGVELLTNKTSLTPATKQAKRVVAESVGKCYRVHVGRADG